MTTFVFLGDFVSQFPQDIKTNAEFDKWAHADYKACNFEAPIYVEGLSATSKSGPALSQSKKSPEFFENQGFNIIQLANNHIMDYGEKGLKSTINAFKKSTIIGAGSSEDAYKIATIKCEGKIVGLLSLVQHEFGITSNNSSKYGTAWINHSCINKMVSNAKSICDYLIVLPHAGFEGIDAPLPEWRQRYKELIDLGADTIIASHPHVPQGWEVYNGKYIFYSLGNFCFHKISNSKTPYWYKSLGVKMFVTDTGLTFDIKNINYSNNIISIDNSKEINEHTQYLCTLLEDINKYEDYVNHELDAFWDTYKLYLLRGLGAISLGVSINTFVHAAYGILKGENIPMLINNFQCETHNWAIQNILRRKIK